MSTVKFTSYFILGLTILALAACGKKADPPANFNFSPTQVSLSKFQGSTSSSWLTDASGNFLTKETTIALEGICGPSVAKIRLTINSVDVSPDPTCDSSALWTYSGSFVVADGTYPIVIQAIDTKSAVIAASALNYNVVKDTVAPVLVAITFPAVNPLVFNSPAPATINGTFTGDLEKMTASDTGGTFSINSGSGTFSYSTYIYAGETRTITLTGYDKVGNVSGTLATTFTRFGDYDSIAPPMAMYQNPGISAVSNPMVSGSYQLERVAFEPSGVGVQSNGGYDLTIGLSQQVMRY